VPILTESQDDAIVVGQIAMDPRDRLEQILSTLATKDDLKAFATKDDLKTFATKDDLKAFATKDDLKAFATKDDLKAFTTKDDLKAFATKDDLEAFATTDEMRAEGERTRQHFNAVAERIEESVRLIAEGHVELDKRVTRVEKKTGLR
jgi:uncharacterized protein (DUF2345 family)